MLIPDIATKPYNFALGQTQQHSKTVMARNPLRRGRASLDAEVLLRLHSRKPSQRHFVYRRDRQPDLSRLATSRGKARGLYEALRRQTPGPLRDVRQCGSSHPPRDIAQEMETP